MEKLLAIIQSLLIIGTLLTSIVVETAIKPVIAISVESTPWIGVASLIGLVGGLFAGWKHWAWLSRAPNPYLNPDAAAVSAEDMRHN